MPFCVDQSTRGSQTKRFSSKLLEILLAVCCGFWGLSPTNLSAQDLSWDRPSEGLAVTVWTPGLRCEGKVPALLLVKMDPERFRFTTYYFQDEGLTEPPTLAEWQRRTQASILFNAGLFQSDYSYMGLLLKDGRSLGSKVHPQWKGLFVAEPFPSGLKKARVLDLAREPFSVEPPAYREAAQSLMLLDMTGKPRVRRTEKRAHQTVVGEDRAGNILLIKTADVVTMWHLAICLRTGLPDLRHAMAMDGGSSSDVVFADVFLPKEDRSGTVPPWPSLVDGSGTGHVPLPAVIGVRPRSASPLRE